MGDWTNGEISMWTQCVWASYFKKISKKAEEGLSLDDEGKDKILKYINKFATECAKEIEDYR